MGGTGGTGGGGGLGTLGMQSPTVDPNRFAGSRAALDAGTSQTPDWSSLTGLLGDASPAASPAAPTSGSPLAVNPTAAGAQYGAPAPGAAGFTSSPYPTATDLPHIGAPDKPVAPVAPEKPASTGWRQIYWPKSADPLPANWQDEWNRMVQHADGTMWVPEDPNAPVTGPDIYGSQWQYNKVPI